VVLRVVGLLVIVCWVVCSDVRYWCWLCLLMFMMRMVCGCRRCLFRWVLVVGVCVKCLLWLVGCRLMGML